MLPEIAALIARVGFDVHRTLCSSGLPPLAHAAFEGHEASVRMLLVDVPGINVNQEARDGTTPLYAAAGQGHETCLQLLLDAPGINVNQPDSTAGVGLTPLNAAALRGHESCVEILLAVPGIDVNSVSQGGQNVLVCAIGHVMNSLRQVGAGDTTRILVRLMASRQVSSEALACAISYLQGFWLTNTQVAEIEDSGQFLTGAQEGTRLLLPVLRAQSTGERRWCGWCWALTPQPANVHEVPGVRVLLRCGRGIEYGLPEEALEGRWAPGRVRCVGSRSCSCDGGWGSDGGRWRRHGGGQGRWGQ